MRLTDVWGRRPIPCREVVSLASDYVDGVLRRRDRIRIDRHLPGCPFCAEFIRQLRATVAALRLVDWVRPDDAARADLDDLYRRWRDSPAG